MIIYITSKPDVKRITSIVIDEISYVIRYDKFNNIRISSILIIVLSYQNIIGLNSSSVLLNISM